jgi:hypothetical protein
VVLWVTREKYSRTCIVWKKKPTWSEEFRKWYGNNVACVQATDYECEFFLGFVPEPSSCREVTVVVDKGAICG